MYEQLLGAFPGEGAFAEIHVPFIFSTVPFMFTISVMYMF